METIVTEPQPKPAFPVCRERLAKMLEGDGYKCIEYFVQYGQKCWVYERDPWEAQAIIRIGQFHDKFENYCQTGNTEPVAA